MIPRLGDGNHGMEGKRLLHQSLEIDSPSRGRKLEEELRQEALEMYSSLEIDSPSRGRKLLQCFLRTVHFQCIV